MTLPSRCAGWVVKNFGFPSGFGTDTVTDTRVIEYVLTNYTLHNKNGHLYMLHTKVCIFTCEQCRIGQEWKKKNALLITHCTPCDKERMLFSTYTCQTPWIVTVTVSRNWRIIGCRIIEVVLYLFPSGGKISYKNTVLSWSLLHPVGGISNYSHAPHNDVSVNDGSHIRRWSHKIIIL